MLIGPAGPRIPDAISVLVADHASTRGLLAMLHRPLSARSRARVIFVLVEDLRIHVQIEEELFYPALAARPGGACDTPVAREDVRRALADLERFSARGADVRSVARRILSLHDEDTAEEERHVFPHARRVLGEQGLLALAPKLCARRRELRRSGPIDQGSSEAPVLSHQRASG